MKADLGSVNVDDRNFDLPVNISEMADVLVVDLVLVE